MSPKVKAEITKIQFLNQDSTRWYKVGDKREIWIHLLAHVDHPHRVKDAKDEEEYEGDAKKRFTLTACLQEYR